MKIEYHPDDDMLVLVLARTPYDASGAEDTNDPDVVLHYDEANRLAEIEVSNASMRVDLDELRRRYSFDEVRASESTPTP